MPVSLFSLLCIIMLRAPNLSSCWYLTNEVFLDNAWKLNPPSPYNSKEFSLRIIAVCRTSSGYFWSGTSRIWNRVSSLVIMNMTLQDNVSTINVEQPVVNASKGFSIRTSIGTWGGTTSVWRSIHLFVHVYNNPFDVWILRCWLQIIFVKNFTQRSGNCYLLKL